MNLLVIATGYPSEQKIYECAFVRPRVQTYRKAGHRVTVVNLSASRSYELDGHQVLSANEVHSLDWTEFDVAVFHSPNIRQHLRLMLRYFRHLPPVCLTFHGHEALYLNEEYPPPYDYLRSRFYPVQYALQNLYDSFKLLCLRTLINRLSRRREDLLLLFVSNGFKEMVRRNLQLDHLPDSVRTAVVPNPAGANFLETKHECVDPRGDFITIRPLDGSKHAVDLVVECAKQNPGHTFHIYGEGRYFEHRPAPDNVTHLAGFVHHENIPALLQFYRGALMPSRCDSQGVMMCEIAVTGMPCLASDLPVHHEMLDGFPNVAFLNNDNPRFQAEKFLAEHEVKADIPGRFDQEKTGGRELELFAALAGSQKDRQI